MAGAIISGLCEGCVVWCLFQHVAGSRLRTFIIIGDNEEFLTLNTDMYKQIHVHTRYFEVDGVPDSDV